MMSCLSHVPGEFFILFYETCNDDDFSDSDRVFPELCCHEYQLISMGFPPVTLSFLTWMTQFIYVYTCAIPLGYAMIFYAKYLNWTNELNVSTIFSFIFGIYSKWIFKDFFFFKLEYTLGMIFQCKSKHIYGG